MRADDEGRMGSSSTASETLASGFTLVLAGGGARGFAHAGVLRALEIAGFRPSGIVGVSMGAVVAATYALNPDWYDLLVTMDTKRFAGSGVMWQGRRSDGSRGVARGLAGAHAMWRLTKSWGSGERSRSSAHALLTRLTRGRELDQGRIPIAVCATDLLTGARVVLDSGPAAEAVYASAALAGVMPPLPRDGRLLCDGAYADLAPIDVARGLGAPIVIAVDPTQQPGAGPIRNGFRALTRAVEICHLRHAELRFQEADFVLSPPFRRSVDVLDFAAKRECVAAGLRAVRNCRPDLARVLAGAGRDDAGRDAARDPGENGPEVHPRITRR